MSEPIKHHYLPVFLLSAWTNDTGKLVEFSRPHREVICRFKSPAATGFLERLYTLPGLPPDRAQFVEKKIMGAIDDTGARVHQRLLASAADGLCQKLSDKEKAEWARFLYALVFRNPEQIAGIQKRYTAYVPQMIEEYRAVYPLKRGPDDPVDFDEFTTRFLANPLNKSGMHVLPHLANSKGVIGHLLQMKFWTISLTGFAGRTFLMSDRPVVMTNGLVQPHAHIVLPISPRRLFVAGKSDAAYRFLRSMSPDKLAATMNNQVARQSHRFVYAIDDCQATFIAARLGQKEKSTPFG